jgi:hypothetical protein
MGTYRRECMVEYSFIDKNSSKIWQNVIRKMIVEKIISKYKLDMDLSKKVQP